MWQQSQKLQQVDCAQVVVSGKPPIATALVAASRG
jgi:hypothetical protein